MLPCFQEMTDLVPIMAQYVGNGQKLICYHELKEGDTHLASFELVLTEGGLIPALSKWRKIGVPGFQVSKMIVVGSDIFLRGVDNLSSLSPSDSEHHSYSCARGSPCIALKDHLLFFDTGRDGAVGAVFHGASKRWLSEKESQTMVPPSPHKSSLRITCSCLTSTGLWLRALPITNFDHLWSVCCFDTILRVHSVLEFRFISEYSFLLQCIHFMLPLCNGLVLLTGSGLSPPCFLVLNPKSCSIHPLAQDPVPKDLLDLLGSPIKAASVLDSPDGDDQYLVLWVGGFWGAFLLSARIHISPFKLGAWHVTPISSQPKSVVHFDRVDDDAPIFAQSPTL